MVEVITSENADAYEDLLDDMFRMRYRVAVEQWGWKIPGIRPGYDRDAFDTVDTIYFVCADPSEKKALACGRLNPTTGPHLLSEVFPEQCEGDLPRGPSIYEFSRYVVDHQGMSKEHQQAVRARIPASVNRFCLEAGITHLTVLAYMSSYARTIKVWPTRPLGLPRYYEQDDATYIAAISEMTAGGLENLRKIYALDPSEPNLSMRVSWREHPGLRRIAAVTENPRVAA